MKKGEWKKLWIQLSKHSFYSESPIRILLKARNDFEIIFLLCGQNSNIIFCLNAIRQPIERRRKTLRMILFYATQFRTTNKVKIRFCLHVDLNKWKKNENRRKKRTTQQQCSPHHFICRFHSIGNITILPACFKRSILIFPCMLKQLLYYCPNQSCPKQMLHFPKRDLISNNTTTTSNWKMIFGQWHEEWNFYNSFLPNFANYRYSTPWCPMVMFNSNNAKNKNTRNIQFVVVCITTEWILSKNYKKRKSCAEFAWNRKKRGLL